MDGWIDGLMNSWLDGWMDGWTGRKMSTRWEDGGERKEVSCEVRRKTWWMDGLMDRWMEGQFDRWVAALMDGLTDEWKMDRWMDDGLTDAGWIGEWMHGGEWQENVGQVRRRRWNERGTVKQVMVKEHVMIESQQQVDVKGMWVDVSMTSPYLKKKRTDWMSSQDKQVWVAEAQVEEMRGWRFKRKETTVRVQRAREDWINKMWGRWRREEEQI